MMSNPTHTVTAVRGDLHDFVVEGVQDWSPAGGKTTAHCPAFVLRQHREMVLLRTVGPKSRYQRGHDPRRGERPKPKGIAREVSDDGSHPGIAMDESEAVGSCETVDQRRSGSGKVEHFSSPAAIDHNQISPRFIHLHFIESRHLFPDKDLIAPAMPGEIAGRQASGIREGEGKYLVVQALAHLGQIAVRQQ